MLAPIAQALASAGRPFTFLALTTARAALDNIGIPSIGFRDLPEAAEPDAQRWGRELAGNLPSKGPVAPEETIAYLGANFRDLVAEHGEAEAHRRYAEAGRQAFLPVSTLRRAIARIAPNLVVATSAPRAERAAILAARQLGIHSVCTVDLFARQEVQWIGQPGYATRVCVINDSVRRMLLERGRMPEEVLVTGNPAFDRLTSPEAMQGGAQLRRDRGWDDGRKIVLWASQIEPARHPFEDLTGDPSLPRQVERTLRALVAANSGLRLVVRYHPSELVEFEPAPRVDFSPVSESITKLLHAVDVVVVTASTVGIEAAISGRPVVSVDSSVLTPDMQYATMGVSQGITQMQDLGPAVFNALAGSRPAFTMEHSNKTATQEILRIIDSFLL